jgi:hypothetical protein
MAGRVCLSVIVCPVVAGGVGRFKGGGVIETPGGVGSLNSIRRGHGVGVVGSVIFGVKVGWCCCDERFSTTVVTDVGVLPVRWVGRVYVGEYGICGVLLVCLDGLGPRWAVLTMSQS